MNKKDNSTPANSFANKNNFESHDLGTNSRQCGNCTKGITIKNDGICQENYKNGKNYPPFEVEIFDTTLRDGAQADGVNFSPADKLAVAQLLESLGIHYVEYGNPYANAQDKEFCEKLPIDLLNKLVSFGSTRRKDIPADKDPNLALLASLCPKNVSIFGKVWDLHATEVLETTKENNLEMLSSSVEFLKKNGKFVIFDAEHFFDGYKSNPDYALSCLKVVLQSEADRIVLCDTNGGSFPEEVYEITKLVCKSFPTAVIGIHAHNDNGCAVANSLAAFRAGAKHIQGTLLGIGERCGNANLATIIANLELKLGVRVLDRAKLKQLTKTCRDIAEIANIKCDSNAPYVGEGAFSHKAGMHCDGVSKLSRSFEHISPEEVGNSRKYPLSDLAGRTTLLRKLSEKYPHLDKNSFELADIANVVKEKEKQGYNYEGADGSFLLLAQRILKGYRSFFELINYKVITEQPSKGSDMATAVIKIKVGKESRLASAEGDGPVHALDNALRMALSDFYPSIKAVCLTDYKVRVLDSREATGAIVRVLMTSTDGEETWSTVGISTDIIQASFFALCDSIDYKLLQSKSEVNLNSLGF